MRLTVIREDGFISVDGENYNEIDLSDMGTTWAIQWYDTWGEVEDDDPLTPNERIEDETLVQPYVDKWTARKAAVAAEVLVAAEDLVAAQAAWDALTDEEKEEAGPRPE